jgi:hypothetical protein
MLVLGFSFIGREETLEASSISRTVERLGSRPK